MALDETTGQRTLTSREQRRLRAFRRRAAVRRADEAREQEARDKRDAGRALAEERRAEARQRRVVGENAAEKIRPRQPVRGENAREKARTPVVQSARETVDEVIAGRDARSSAAKLARLKLSGPEKRDIEGYSRSRSEQTQRQVFAKLKRDTAGGLLDYVTAPANVAVLGHPNLRTGVRGQIEFFRDTREKLRAAPRTIQDPDTSRREKLEAAVAMTARAGVRKPRAGELGGGKAPRPDAPPPRPTQWEGKKPGDKFTYTGPNGKGQGYIDDAGKPRNEKGEELFGIGNPYPVEGLKSEIKAKLASGNYEYVGPLPAEALEALDAGRLRRSSGGGAAPPPLRPTRASGAGDEQPLPGLGRTKPEASEQIIAALPRARELRRQQEKLYSAERGRRAARAEQAMQVGGQEGYRAALGALKGELPKLKFGALEEFDQKAADELFTHVQQNTGFRPFEKVSTQSALRKVLDGSVPTRGEIKLLERAFGPEVATQIAESIPFWSKAKNAGLSVINVPRSLMSSYDLSAPFRQGLVLSARHPRIFASEWRPMVKALRSERAYEDVMDEIVSRPTFKAMQNAKLQLSDVEGLATREDYFMSNLAEQIPLVGRGVRASGRAYTAFLNKFRADAFDNYLRVAEKQGLDINDPVLLKSVARWVNHATGRGSIKSLEGAMVPLTAAFFSPRLIASRLQLLNPAFYATLDPFARRQAVQGMTQLLGGISMTLWLAKLAGAEVVIDPRSSDFGKIKLGDTRIDVAGGLQQYLVYAARMITGETVSSTTGEVRKLEGGFGKPSRADITWRFVSNKFAPVPAYAKQWAENENRDFEPFDPLRDAPSSLLPLGAQNAYEGFQEGPGTGAVSLGLGSIGFGVQTYRAKPKSLRGLSAIQRLDEDFRETLKQARADAKRFEVPGGLPKTVAAELRWRHARNRALAKAEDEKGRDLDARERATIAARLLIERYPQARQPVEAALREARTASDFKSLYRRISDEATETLRRWNEEMNAAKRESEPALP